MFAVPYTCNVELYSLKDLQLKYNLDVRDKGEINHLRISKDQKYLIITVIKRFQSLDLLVFDISKGIYSKICPNLCSRLQENQNTIYIENMELSEDNSVLLLIIYVDSLVKAVVLDMENFEILSITSSSNVIYWTQLSPVEPVFFTVEKGTIKKYSYKGQLLAELNRFSKDFNGPNFLVDFSDYRLLEDGSLFFSVFYPTADEYINDIIYLKINSDLNKVEITDHGNFSRTPFSDVYINTPFSKNVTFSTDSSECYVRIDSSIIYVYDIETRKSNFYNLQCYSEKINVSDYRLLTVTQDYLIFDTYPNITSFWYSRKSDQIIRFTPDTVPFYFKIRFFSENAWHKRIIRKIFNLLTTARVLNSLQRANENTLAPDVITLIIKELLKPTPLFDDDKFTKIATFLRSYTSREKSQEWVQLRASNNKEVLRKELLELLA